MKLDPQQCSTSPENLSKLGIEIDSRKKRKPKRGNRLDLKKKFNNVLHCVHENLGLTKNSKLVLNSLVNDVFERLTDQAILFQKAAKRATLTHQDMASACSVLFSGGLKDHAKAAGTQAVAKYLETYQK